jgi:hypothetical protein
VAAAAKACSAIDSVAIAAAAKKLTQGLASTDLIGRLHKLVVFIVGDGADVYAFINERLVLALVAYQVGFQEARIRRKMLKNPDQSEMTDVVWLGSMVENVEGEVEERIGLLMESHLAGVRSANSLLKEMEGINDGQVEQEVKSKLKRAEKEEEIEVYHGEQGETTGLLVAVKREAFSLTRHLPFYSFSQVVLTANALLNYFEETLAPRLKLTLSEDSVLRSTPGASTVVLELISR